MNLCKRRVARFLAVCAAMAVWPSLAAAATLSGTVKDPAGAVAPNALVEISGGNLAQPLTAVSDAQGHFGPLELKPGAYVVRVTCSGFQPSSQRVDVGEAAIELQIQLAISTARQEITVHGNTTQFANSDPVYQRLRRIGFGKSFQIKDFTLSYDVATFHFIEGTLTFLEPVQGLVTGAVFIGQAHFSLKPATTIDGGDLYRRIRAEQVDEDVAHIVFRFTDGSNRSLLRGLGSPTETPRAAAEMFAEWQQCVRQRRESPLGFSEELLTGEEMDNVDADVLASVYNPDRPGFFTAYMRGTKHKDLRLYVRRRGGAIPALGSPEEIGLVNYDPEGIEDGVWYLAHFRNEYQNGKATSLEERRFASARAYKLDTVVGNNDHLTSTAMVTFEPLIDGERVFKFLLLPNLRASRVTDAEGKDLYFIQENRKADGSLYVILPQAAKIGSSYSVRIEYAGDHVIYKAGPGSYFVHARESWYPHLNTFIERSTYQLTYHYPKKDTLISAGNLEKEWEENQLAASRWTTPKPILVAGFNFGEYKQIEIPDSVTGYRIEGYYLSALPDQLQSQPALAAMAPKAMAKYALEQTRAQLQLCTAYFGRSPFDHISITEQPDFNFGQSWPTLVYLPISAYMDSTQRWMLLGQIDSSLNAFIQEVTPHEVAHQWWGHAVDFATYHDEWLSEGFAEFSAALFLQQAMGPGWEKDYIEFWRRLRKRILEKNQFGAAPNDAGPLWLGLRLISPRSAQAYQNVTYPKGAYVLAMLRSVMYSNQDRDKVFIETMHDFVQSYQNAPASTESFKEVVEKHMTPRMDLDGNRRMDWFFNGWVYGTEIPHYEFAYKVSPAADGKTRLHLSITQSKVDERFKMLVPVFADFGKGMVRIGQAPLIGNSTRELDVQLPIQPKKVALNAYQEILEQ